MMNTSTYAKWKLVSVGLAPVLGLLTVLGTVATPPARAQSLGLAPAEVRYKFQPGQPFEFDLAVSNDGATPEPMRVSVTDFWYNDKNEKVFGTPGSSPRSAANWLEFVPRQLTVPARGTSRVKVIATPPLQVSGGYYAVIFVESKPQLAQPATVEKKAVYTNLRLGCLVLLSAKNTEHYGIKVSDAQFTPPGANNAMELAFTLDNQSNTHIFPETRLAILDSQHGLAAKAEGEVKRFLPQQKERLSITWSGTLSRGSYTAILTVLYGEDQVYTQEFPFEVPPGPKAQAALAATPQK
jgi:hypothetical protein